jgi:hypothetical protein
MSKPLSPEQWWNGLLSGENLALPVQVIGMSSATRAGEMLISQSAYIPKMNLDALEQRQPTLKGKCRPIFVSS